VQIAATGVCHTMSSPARGPTPRDCSRRSSSRRRRDRGRRRARRHHAAKGDHVIPLYTPECRQCKVLPVAQDESVHGHPRHAGKGVMPDGTSRFSSGSEKIHHYMAARRSRTFTVLPEIALARIREDAPFDKVCYIGCGSPPHRRGDQHRQGGGRPRSGGLRLGHRSQRRAGGALVGPTASSAGTSTLRGVPAEKFGLTHS